MSLRIRPFADDDYAATVAVGNAALPEYTSTVDEWRHWDAHRDPKCRFQRFVVELDGEIVGYSEYENLIWMFHPRKFGMYIAVRPELQGQGIGRALFNHLQSEIEAFDPISIRSRTREDQVRAVRFLTDRGFEPGMRDWESRLDVTTFDFSPYAGAEEHARKHGITIKTFRELEADPDRNRKLYELEQELVQDVPMPEPHTPIGYEFFVENVLKNPNLLPDGYFVAVHDGEYVGMSNLWSSQAIDDLYTGLTGVKRTYRRKGIALALKLRAIAYAREHHTPIIRTWNESNNRAMLAINERLGFVKQPIWINFTKVIAEDDGDAAPAASAHEADLAIH